MDAQLPAMLAANEGFQASGFHAVERTPQPTRHIVILSCMDARLDLFRALGLEVGDAHILRNAGGRATDDALRSLVVSTHLLGTREIGIVHHTDCGLEGADDDAVAAKTGVSIRYLGFSDVEASVREDVAAIVESGLLPTDVTVWGAVYDVDNGAVRVVTS